MGRSLGANLYFWQFRGLAAGRPLGGQGGHKSITFSCCEEAM